ncbi:MAG: GAF domain-containing protein, partial [Chloroflexota bacterium]
RAADVAESLDALCPRIHSIISEVMPAENFYIALLSTDKSMLHFVYFVDEVDDMRAGQAATGRGLTEYVLRTGKSLLSNPTVESSLAQKGEIELLGPPSQVWLGVPLMVDGVAIGVMVVQHYHDPNAYGKREQRMLEFVSSQVALMLKRKQAEDALRASEERFRSLFENSTIGLYRTTPDGQILLSNPALLKMLGFDSLEEIQVRNLEEEGFLEPDARADFRQRLAMDGEVRGYEAIWVHKDGSPVFVRESARAIRDESGHILYYEGTVEDITEQRRAERSLEQKVGALEALSAIDRDILAAKNPDEILELVCRRSAALLGVSKSAIASLDANGWHIHATHGLQNPRLLDEGMAFSLKAGQQTKVTAFEISDIPSPSPYLPEFCASEGIRAVIGEPVQAGPGKHGILLLFSAGPRAWTREDGELLRALAGQASLALEKAYLLSSAEQRAEAFGALYSVTRDLTVESELDVVLNTVADLARRLLDVPAAYIFLYEEKEQVLFLTVTKGVDLQPGLAVKLGEGLAGRVAAKRKPMFVKNYHNWRYRNRALDHVPFSSILEVPMQFSGQLIGVMVVSEVGETIRDFTEEDTRLLSLLAGQAASAVYNSRLFGDLQRSNYELDRLYRASTALIEGISSDAGRLYQLIVKIIAAEFEGSICTLWLASKGSRALRCVAMAGSPDDYQVSHRLTVDGPGLIARSIQNGSVLNAGDVREIQDFVPGWEKARSELVIPLKSGAEVFGALDLQTADLRAFGPDDERMMTLFSVRVVSMLEHVRLVDAIEQSLKRLSALHTIDVAISSSLDLRVTLNVFLEQVTSQLHVDAVAVLLLNPELQMLEYAAGRGFRRGGMGGISLLVGEDAAGRAALERVILASYDLDVAAASLQHPERIAGEGFVASYAVPLIARGQVKGVMELYYRERFVPDPDWNNFLETLARQAAVAIDDAHLFDRLQRSFTELTVAYDAAIEGWARALELRGVEPEGHSQRLSEMTLDLARRMGVPEENLVNVYRGVLLHDIGKLAISDSILLKAGPLTPEEWERIREHPLYAYDILSPIEYLRPSINIPYYHHEKWDGSGYPFGLRGEQIPLEARIFAVVDAWDILRTDRPQRLAWNDQEVIDYLLERSGADFDPQVVENFLLLLGEKKVNR